MHRKKPIRLFVTAVALTVVAWVATASQDVADKSRQANFHAENQAAMERMMAGMNVQPSGNVDRDFAIMMIAHHQGAIDMAMAELGFGKNTVLRRIAQEIVVTQRQEIEVMRHEIALSFAAKAASAVPGPVNGAASAARNRQ